MTSIREKIAETIVNAAASVEDKVVDVFVDREVAKRSEALVKVIDKINDAENSLKKIRPDQISYNEKGEKVQESFSKGKLDEKNKLHQQIDKIMKAITKALENNDYGDVYNLAGGKDQGKGGGKDSGEASADTAE